MLWKHYVFRRGRGIHELWNPLFHKRRLRLLYVAGCGFDVRAQAVMRELLHSISEAGSTVEEAKLLLVGFRDYVLDERLQTLTEENGAALQAAFSGLGPTEHVFMSTFSEESG